MQIFPERLISLIGALYVELSAVREELEKLKQEQEKAKEKDVVETQ